MSWSEQQNMREPETHSLRDGRQERDWEEQRRRQWEDYDRDPTSFSGERRENDPPRGRTRSPPPDIDRKRRRSPSPWDRGRYEPRPRYGDERDNSRFREDFHPGRRHGYGNREHRSHRPPPPNPYDQDHPVPLKQFADWFRHFYPEQAAEEDRLDQEAQRQPDSGSGGKSRDGIRRRWETYKKSFVTSQLSIMFDYHKKSPWFAEKYDPSEDMVALRKRVRKEGWKGRISRFILELDEGQHDPDSTIEKIAEPGEPEHIIKAEDSAIDEVKPVKQEDDDAGFGMDVEDEQQEDVKADNTGKATYDERKNPMHNTVSVMPEGNEVLIRTIPPDIGRVKLEECCATIPGFIHLALAEPQQRRNFYRAGWIRFQDGTDMENAVRELSEKKVDGFKLHVTHTTRPFVSRTKVTPDVASRPERIKKDLAQIKELAALLEEEAAQLRQLRINRTRDAATKHEMHSSLNGHNGSMDQDELHVDPIKAEGAMNAVNGSVDGTVEGELEADMETEPNSKGTDAVEKRLQKLYGNMQEGLSDDGLGLECKKDAIALDLYQAFLRTAFNTCYYCAAITDHVEELHRKCVKHVRKPLSEKALQEVYKNLAQNPIKAEKEDLMKVENSVNEPPTVNIQTESLDTERHNRNGEVREWKRNDERWLDWLDNKTALLIKRRAVDPKEYGGKDYEEELAKACEAHIKQEDEGKFRCKQCNKLFKAVSFVEKHLANKHSEALRSLEDLTYFNNFALDPHRIQPSSYPPPSAGNNSGPPAAYGLKTPHWPIPQGPEFNHHRGGYQPQGPYPVGPPGGHGGYPLPGHFETWSHMSHPSGYQQPPIESMVAGQGNSKLRDRMGGFAEYSGHVDGLPLKPSQTNGPRAPPPNVKEDPRAHSGRKISYHDIDKAAVGDDVNIELSY